MMHQQLRARALEALRTGDLAQARAAQAELLAALEQAGRLNADDLMHSALIAFNSGRPQDAFEFLLRAEALQPENGLIKWNLVQTQVVARNYARALDLAWAALRVMPEYHEAQVVLARIHGGLGHLAEARRYGEQALLAADARARGVAWPIPEAPPKAFDACAIERNIIAFSLWGRQARYIDNALANARLWPHFYPEWMLRFYCEGDTVDADVIQKLRDLGAEVIVMARQKMLYEGLFWRMLVIAQVGVDRFLVRDVDSLFSVRERIAVDEWLASVRYFHVMRDHYTQTDLIQAGLWGGVGGVLPPLNDLLQTFKLRHAPTRMVDQAFLGAVVWPTVRQSVLIHDSVYRVFGAQPYPAYGAAPSGGYLGACPS
jgi:tetratricopeptide (TPR) repeat protein